MLSHELPIYRSAYTLTLDAYALVHEFPREYKYTIGERLQISLLDLLTGIYHANSVMGSMRRQRLDHVILLIETIRMCTRLAYDLRIFPISRFAKISEQIEGISKQSLAWRASTPESSPSDTSISRDTRRYGL